MNTVLEILETRTLCGLLSHLVAGAGEAAEHDIEEGLKVLIKHELEQFGQAVGGLVVSALKSEFPHLAQGISTVASETTHLLAPAAVAVEESLLH
ncbi:MAG TPA: hypothetical protein PLV25_03565, partial [Opitutales bacterium]|nr:hypothetical protein [Opitutales bacterium]